MIKPLDNTLEACRRVMAWTYEKSKGEMELEG